jgi:CBS domain containing-hemolysin-like protein
VMDMDGRRIDKVLINRVSTRHHEGGAPPQPTPPK